MINLNFLKYYRNSFGAKTFYLFTLFITTISVVFIGFFIYHQKTALRNGLIHDGTQLAEFLSYTSKLAVYTENGNLLADSVDGAMQNKAVILVQVFNASGKELIARKRLDDGIIEDPVNINAVRPTEALEKFEKDLSLSYSENYDEFEFLAPVFLSGQTAEEDFILSGEDSSRGRYSFIGFVKIVFTKEPLRKSINAVLFKNILMLMGFIVFSGFIIYYLVQNKITKPLSGLAESAQALGEGDFSRHVTDSSNDEIGSLAKSFNHMADSLRKRESENQHLLGELTQSKKDWEETFNSMTDMITIHDKDFSVIRVNKAAKEMLDLSSPDVNSTLKCFKYFHTPDYPPDNCPSCACLTTQKPGIHEAYIPFLEKHFEVRSIPRFNGDNELVGVIHVARDVTEQRRLEEQLRHAQKMEAIGQLAGGVAHDFNNILTAVMGYGHLLQMKLQDGDPLKHNLDKILKVTERGAELTRSLLAFSRKQAVGLRPVSISKILETSSKLLPGLIGERIEVKTILAEERLTILADSVQIEQIIMNLASNARDAMPDGGTLTITADRMEMDSDYVTANGYGDPGSYAMLSFTDNGIGMDEEAKSKIFDPFFTTKKVGEGTGLGLAIVYGIVKQHNGYITIESEKGKGTTFRIYFPLVNEKAEDDAAEVSVPTGGKETILIAEDEAAVREPLKTSLEIFGYDVIETVDGKDAIEKFKENKERVNLLIFDVIMPKMNGKEAYDEIRQIKPDIKAIFTSGYTANTLQTKEIVKKGLTFISKPVSPQNLLRKIREVLDRETAA
jgi:PAS domain S-box-containing protein